MNTKLFFLLLFLPGLLVAQYSEQYRDYAQKHGVDTAIAVVGYNRQNYFKQTIEAIAKNPESETLPIFFFLDGGVGSRQKEHLKIIKRCGFKNSHPIPRRMNYGVGRNIIDARRFLFDWCQFERVILIEDDNLISPTYISLLLNLHKWAKQNYTNVGIVGGWCYQPHARSQEDRMNHLNGVRASLDNLWGYLIEKKTWDTIKPKIYEYENTFLQGNYGSRNHNAINNWVKELVKNESDLSDNTHPFPYTLFPTFQDKIFRNHMATGQDVVTMASLYAAGFVYVVTDVNRMMNIGKHGFHSNPDFWKVNFKHIKFEIFPHDDQITEFVPLPLKPEDLIPKQKD